MALNEMIAQGAQFKMPDPLEQYGRIAQIQQAQNQNALAQYQISSAQRADETNTNFLGALRAAGNDPMKIQQAYINAGKGKEASEYATSLLTQQKARGDILKQQRDNFSADLLDLSGNPSDEKINFLAKNIATDSNYPPAFQAIAARKFSELLATPFADRSKILSMSGASVGERATAAQNQFTNTKPNFIERTDGNSKWMEDTNPNSATYRQIQSFNQVQLTPGEKSSAQTAANLLAFNERKQKYEEENPGFTIERTTLADGTERFKKVNKKTGVATDVMDASGVAVTGVNLPAQTAAIRQKFDQDKLDFERKFPGFTIEKATQADGTIKFKKVDKLSGVATDVMDVSGTPLTGAEKTTVSPLATLQKELAAMPPNSKQADEHRKKILKDITDTSQAQLKLAQDRFAWDKANPGYYTQALNNEDGSQRFVAVNRLTLKAYPITESAISSGTPPNIGAPLVGPAAGVVPAPVAAQTVGGLAMAGQPLISASSKGLTESQGNATAFGMRMKDANELLSELENKGQTNTGLVRGVVGGTLGLVPLIGDKLNDAAGNIFNVLPGVLGGLSPEQQQIQNARINFITAVLRKESGAAIGQNEFVVAERLYFPQPGNDATVIKQKQNARNLAIKAMMVQAGPGAKSISGSGADGGAAGSGGIPNATPTNPLGLTIPGVK